MTTKLVVDARERSLIKLLGKEIEVRTLEVGDIMCEYEDGSFWIAERKTADDLAASIHDGRWEEQKDRLLKSGGRVIYIIEGDFRSARFSFQSLMGACVNAAVRDDLLIFRTWAIEETKQLVQQLVKKFPSASTAPRALGLAGLTSKRKKDSEAETIWIRQIMCVPTISESIARAILKHFGTIHDLQQALKDPKAFPDVLIGPNAKLGRARINKLAEVFA